MGIPWWSSGQDSQLSLPRVVFLLSLRPSVLSNYLRPHGLQPAMLLCPWDSPDKDTGVGFHFLLQGIFLTQESNPCLLCWQADSLLLRLLGPGFKPWCWGTKIIQAVQCGKKKKRERERKREKLISDTTQKLS